MPRKHALAQFPSLTFRINIRGVSHIDCICSPTSFRKISKPFLKLFLVVDPFVFDDVGYPDLVEREKAKALLCDEGGPAGADA